ncbi:xanthine dehydrogenase family protein subunit M [Nocardioides sp. SYSU D00065]|uniref:FAD binding domain-containing protein n=1 Tax=Nocardioides sp. SYSU D00065 TaxID=2817378 RepID=UPI001B332442|nr:xanthine dehydrogenase family protein subunit M [Nocardioides sp. SYSU D00065]
MRALDYRRPESAQEAVELVSSHPGARYLAGGSNLVDHLKLGVAAPDVLVDVSRLPLDDVEEVEGEDGAVLRIGANVRNSDLAAHPVVRSRFPVVARATLAGASGQIRNQATTAGNLLQRTRCVYFQDVTTACNKRKPGTGCSALGGYARYNAILGASAHCVTTHPSDLAVGLAAVDATVVVLGVEGERRIRLEDLHRLPGDRPEADTTLAASDLITAVELPMVDTDTRSTYAKVRDRASFAFALVSVAATLRMEGDRVGEVRIAWGGVAHKPWRARRAEAALTGGGIEEDAVRAAVDEELATATTDDGTAYKVAMVRNTTTMTLLRLAGEVRR